MREIESIHGKALTRWAFVHRGQWPELRWLFHIPNGGRRNKAAAGKMKAEGVKIGVADYCLPCARGGFFGLYVELKAPGYTYPTPDQKDFLQDMRDQGYRAEWCRGWEDARDILIDYLNQPKTEVVRADS